MNTTVKIGIVCDKFPLLSQTFVQRQADLLGAEVFALEQTTEPRPAEWSGSIHAIGLKPGRGRMRRWGEKFYRRLFHLPWRIWLPGDQRRLRRKLCEGQISAVIVEFGECLVGCASGVFGSGVKVVPHFHGVDLSAHLRDPRYVRRLQQLLKKCPEVIVVNKSMQARLRGLLGYQGVIHVLPCGANPERFANLARSAHIGLQFLFVGRLVEKKGIRELVGAFAQYRAWGGRGRLIIAGDGPQLSEVRQLIKNSSLGDVIELKGAVPPAQVVALMAQADIYVQHSKTTAGGDEEGWPVAIAEACLAGLPVVATRHAGIAEQVQDGKTGFLVNEGDIDAMARAMFRLAESAELRSRFGEAARTHIAKFCDSALYRENLLDILLGNHERPVTA